LVKDKSYKINNKKLLSLKNNDKLEVSQNTKIQSKTINQGGKISGTSVTVTNGQKKVEGIGTKFTEELLSGDIFIVGTSNVQHVIHYIESDTVLYLVANSSVTVTGIGYKIVARNNTNKSLYNVTGTGHTVKLKSNQISLTGSATIPAPLDQNVGTHLTYDGLTKVWTFNANHNLSVNDTIKFTTNGGGASAGTGTTSYDTSSTYHVVKKISDTEIQLSLSRNSYPVDANVNSTGNWKADKVSLNIDGTGTKFLSELVVGDLIILNLETRIIEEIYSDTKLKITNAFTNNTNAVINENSPKMKINLNNEFEVGDYLTFLDSSDNNNKSYAYILRIESDNKIALSSNIGNTSNYFISRQPKSFSVWAKNADNSTFCVDADNHKIGINKVDPNVVLDIKSEDNSSTLGLLNVEHENTNLNNTTTISRFRTNSNTSTTLAEFQATGSLDNGNLIKINAPKLATGIGINMDNLDLLTTGKAINIVSNSEKNLVRSLIYVQNKNADAKKTTILELKQDTVAMEVPTLNITSAQESDKVINVTSNSLKDGYGIYLTSNGTGDSMTGNLMDITFDGNHAGNTGNLLSLTSSGTSSKTVALKINQEAIVSPAMKLTNGSYASDNDNFSETYLLKGIATVANGRKDFDININDDSTYFLRAFIVGRFKGGSVKSGVYTIDSFIDKTSGTLTIDYIIDEKKETDATWDVQLIDNNNNLRIRCIGDQFTRWLIKMELTKVSN